MREKKLLNYICLSQWEISEEQRRYNAFVPLIITDIEVSIRRVKLPDHSGRVLLEPDRQNYRIRLPINQADQAMFGKPSNKDVVFHVLGTLTFSISLLKFSQFMGLFLPLRLIHLRIICRHNRMNWLTRLSLSEIP